MASDGETFILEVAAATKLGAIKNMVEDGYSEGELAVIPLPNVDGKILGMVVEWCKKHANDDDKDKVKKWDEEFVNDKDEITLWHLTKAADYLISDELVELMTTKVANMIKDKTVEEIRELFNIENDFSPKEEEQIRNKHPWAYDIE